MKTNNFKFKPLSTAMRAVLFTATGLLALNTASLQAAEEEEEAEEDQKIVITGSRIKRNQAESAKPITVIGVEELEKKGFTNVFDALKGLTQSTGQIVGEQSANSSGGTAGQAVNIRGFGPGRTLALLNGRRVTDNPTASYTGGSYFNWAIIPIAAVERIEILTGGASAIYGSDAVAGVINVILKNDLDELTLGLRYGETPEGGGESTRFQVIGGSVTSDYSLTYAIEHQSQEAIQGLDRDHLDSAFDNPNYQHGAPVSYGLNSWLYSYADGGFVNPSEADCAAQGAFVSEYTFNPALGNACYDDLIGEFTIRNPRDRNSAIVNFNYTLDSDTEFFARALYWDSETNNQIFRKFIQAVQPTAEYPGWINYVRSFDPVTEVAPSSFTEQETYVFATGLSGMWGEYDWETGLNYSKSKQSDRNRQFKQDAVNQIVAETNSNPWAPFDISSLDDDAIGDRTSDAESSSIGIDFIFSGSLMELDAGDIEFAAIAEFQHTEYEIVVDEIARQGQDVDGGWTNGSADFGSGERDRFAVGLELAVPLTENLELGFATRYDDYDDGSSVGGRLSSQLQLAFRPTDELLLRTSFAESFRAPDMHFLFRERADAFLRPPVDIAQCRYADEVLGVDGAYPNCLDYTQTSQPRWLAEGNPELEEETGENFGAGLVYDFSDDLSITLDYFKISLDNLVQTQTSSSLIAQEANCWLGTNRNGDQSYDPNSAECQEAFRVVERDDPTDTNGDGMITPDELGAITRVRPSYININSLEQSGIDFRLDYSLQTEGYGNFNFSVATTHVTTYKFTLNDTERDIRETNQEPKDRINLTASWVYDDFSSTLFLTKIGSILNDGCFTGISDEGVEYLDPSSTTCNELDADGNGIVKRGDSMVTANLNLAYRFNDHFGVNLQIVNLTDDKGPQDLTLSQSAAQGSGWPWVNPQVYSLTGREVFLEARYTF